MMASLFPENRRDSACFPVLVKAGTRIGALFNRPPLDSGEMRILLEYGLGLSRVELVTQSERELNENEAALLSCLLSRRQASEPVAYIVGEREFYGLPFLVTPDVLIPRPETELLVELAIEYLPENGRVLDLGTGSGAIAVAVSHERPDVFVTATDISFAALDVARKNAWRNLGESGRIVFFQGNWFDALREPLRFDLIVSNPPYIAKDDRHLSEGDLRHEPQHALTDSDDGLSVFRLLASAAPTWLGNNGWLWVEHGYDQAVAVRELLEKGGFISVQSRPDLAGIARASGGFFPGLVKHSG